MRYSGQPIYRSLLPKSLNAESHISWTSDENWRSIHIHLFICVYIERFRFFSLLPPPDAYISTPRALLSLSPITWSETSSFSCLVVGNSGWIRVSVSGVGMMTMRCGCTTPPWITAGMKFSERLSNAGLSTSLMTYLTKVLHEEMKVAAKNVNYWVSVTMLMPLLGGFLADGYLGRFSTVVFSTAVYLLNPYRSWRRRRRSWRRS